MSIPQTYAELMAGQANGLKGVFQEYELLVAKADLAFRKVAGKYAALVNCRERCCDCCHAVFGLFPIESVYLSYHFQTLDGERRGAVIPRARRFERELAGIRERLRRGTHPEGAGHPPEGWAGNSGDLSQALARERARCPLLGEEQRCLLYVYRPVTCRVYGIPTIIQGRSHVCGKSGFTKGPSFPAFNLDLANRELYRLSGQLLETIGHPNAEEASSLLLSVSRSCNVAPAELLKPSGEKRRP